MVNTVINFFSELNTGVLIVIGLSIFIGLVAKWRLFDKCGLSNKEILLGTILPIYDFFLTLKIVGRPARNS